MVKVGPIEQHLVSKGFPDAKEICLLIHLDRVISEWITRAIIRAGRRREPNHNCDNRYKYCHMHIQHAPISTPSALRQVGKLFRELSHVYFPFIWAKLTVETYATPAKSAGKILGTSLHQSSLDQIER